MKINKNGGPKEDQGLCVWCEDLKLVSIDAGFTAPGSW